MGRLRSVRSGAYTQATPGRSLPPQGRSSRAYAQSWPVLVRPRPGSSTGAVVSSGNVRLRWRPRSFSQWGVRQRSAWADVGSSEPLLVSRRPFGLGQAAKAWTLACA